MQNGATRFANSKLWLAKSKSVAVPPCSFMTLKERAVQRAISRDQTVPAEARTRIRVLHLKVKVQARKVQAKKPRPKTRPRVQQRMLKTLRMSHVTTVVPKGTMPTSAPIPRNREGTQAASLGTPPHLPLLLGAPEAHPTVAPMAPAVDLWIRYATSTSHGARLSKVAPRHALQAKTADSSMQGTRRNTRRNWHRSPGKQSPEVMWPEHPCQVCCCLRR